ncbi:GNAT family N-acetyltransferase [Deltaproteobacteria bacterium TL4]
MSIKDQIHEDPWLGQRLGKYAGKLNVSETLHELSDAEHPETVNFKKILEQSRGFLFAKVKVDDLKSVALLEKWGFHLVDTNILLSKNLLSSTATQVFSGVRFTQPEDEEETVEVAQTSFVFSRFHLDPLVSNQTADHLKAEWVRNFYQGNRGEQLIVAIVNHHVAGFLLLLHPSSTTWVIDLIAVSPDHQRQGMAQNMISFAEQNCSDIGVFKVGTQMANIPSLNLYQTLGFKMENAHYVFHYHW